MARRRARSRTRPPAQRNNRRAGDNEGIIPVLARAVREVEGAVQRGPVRPSTRTKFQVVGLLVREERARIKADRRFITLRRSLGKLLHRKSWQSAEADPG